MILPLFTSKKRQNCRYLQVKNVKIAVIILIFSLNSLDYETFEIGVKERGLLVRVE